MRWPPNPPSPLASDQDTWNKDYGNIERPTLSNAGWVLLH